MPDSETRVIAPMMIIRKVMTAVPSASRAKPGPGALPDRFSTSDGINPSLGRKDPKGYRRENRDRNKQKNDCGNRDGRILGQQAAHTVRVRRIEVKGEFPVRFPP